MNPPNRVKQFVPCECCVCFGYEQVDTYHPEYGVKPVCSLNGSYPDPCKYHLTQEKYRELIDSGAV